MKNRKPLSQHILKWYPGDGQNYDSSEPSNGATFSVLVTDDGKEEILYTKRN